MTIHHEHLAHARTLAAIAARLVDDATVSAAGSARARQRGFWGGVSPPTSRAALPTARTP